MTTTNRLIAANHTIDSLLALSKVLGLRLHFSNGSNSSGDVQG